MAPRKTKHGASANARQGSSRAGASASSRARATGSSSGAKSSRTPNAKRPSSSSARRPAPKASKARQAKAKPVAQRRWWTLPVVCLVAVVLFIWTYYPVAAVQYRETREAARLRAELAQIKSRNGRLRTQVERLKTPAGVEDYARSELGLVKKGENVVVVVDGGEAEEASKAVGSPRIDSDETTSAPVGPWTAFLDLVFGIR